METPVEPVTPFLIGKMPKTKYATAQEFAEDFVKLLAISAELITVPLVSLPDLKGDKGDKGAKGNPGGSGPPGPQGNPGTPGAAGASLVWMGSWVIATDYLVNHLVENAGVTYICTVLHTADADKEPGIGVDWTAYWETFPMDPFTVGVTDGSAAAAGEIGEYQETIVLAGAPVGLANGVAENLATLSLTAGDWDVWGTLTFVATAATVTELAGGIGLVTDTLPTAAKFSGLQFTTTTFKESISVMPQRVLSSGTGNVFIVARATFSAGSVDVYGEILARRRR